MNPLLELIQGNQQSVKVCEFVLIFAANIQQKVLLLFMPVISEIVNGYFGYAGHGQGQSGERYVANENTPLGEPGFKYHEQESLRDENVGGQYQNGVFNREPEGSPSE